MNLTRIRRERRYVMKERNKKELANILQVTRNKCGVYNVRYHVGAGEWGNK